MTDEEIEEQLAQILQRLDRIERVVYVVFDDIRRVAEYSYQLAVRPDPEPGDPPIRRMSHMRPLSHNEATRDGLDMARQIVIKSIWKTLGFGVRHDVLAIAKEMAERIMVKAGETPADADAQAKVNTPA
jgi:hypothetical protein